MIRQMTTVLRVAGGLAINCFSVPLAVALAERFEQVATIADNMRNAQLIALADWMVDMPRGWPDATVTLPLPAPTAKVVPRRKAVLQRC
jgi:hypothetical protein